jgi:hypothetical protein
MEYLASAVFQNQEHEQHPQPDCRNRKEINRYDLAQLIPEESLPRLRRLPWKSPQIRETVRSDIVMPSIFNSP